MVYSMYSVAMTSSSFAGKTCVITGAASGIGRATAVALAKAGAVLCLTDANAVGLRELARELEGGGARVLVARALDVSNIDAVRRFAQAVHGEVPSVDLLFNIAGIAVWGSVETLRHEDYRRVIDVNLMGPIHLIECFVPPMIHAGRGGHVVNVASAAGLFGLPWHAAYSASKFGLRGLSEVLRFDLRRHGIHVSLVCPGAVDTGLVQTLQVRGVDADHPALAELRRRFRAHAVTPERAAAAMLRGVAGRRSLIFTSADVRVGHFIQNKLGFPYELAMRVLNDVFQARAQKAAVSAPPKAPRDAANAP
jgi:NAD(P)-dependent dehydrogenase (short-subunit alcohol dehydrogenase family)